MSPLHRCTAGCTLQLPASCTLTRFTRCVLMSTLLRCVDFGVAQAGQCASAGVCQARLSRGRSHSGRLRRHPWWWTAPTFQKMPGMEGRGCRAEICNQRPGVAPMAPSRGQGYVTGQMADAKAAPAIY